MNHNKDLAEFVENPPLSPADWGIIPTNLILAATQCAPFSSAPPSTFFMCFRSLFVLFPLLWSRLPAEPCELEY